MHQWTRWFPVAILIPTLPCLVLVATVLLHPAIGVQILPQWGTDPSATQVVAVACILTALVLVFDAVAAWLATGGPAPAVTIRAGEPATFLRRGAVRFTGNAILIATFALLMVVLGWLGLRAGSVVIAVLLFLGAMAVGGVVVPIVLRRYSTGGVWLTPAGLVDRFRGTEVTLGWDDVAAVDYGRLDFSALLGGAPSVLFGGEYPMVVRTRRPYAHTLTHLTPIWRSPRKHAAHAVYLEMPEIGVTPGTLARVIVHYAANPAARGELGTERSLQTIACLRDHPEMPVFGLLVDARAGWGAAGGPVPGGPVPGGPVPGGPVPGGLVPGGPVPGGPVAGGRPSSSPTAVPPVPVSPPVPPS